MAKGKRGGRSGGSGKRGRGRSGAGGSGGSGRRPASSTEYTDAEGNVLTLRDSLTPGTIAKIQEAPPGDATSRDDAWQRRMELAFERLAVRWVITELPIEDQAMLLGRYRMADDSTRSWVHRTVADHIDRHIPELT